MSTPGNTPETPETPPDPERGPSGRWSGWAAPSRQWLARLGELPSRALQVLHRWRHQGLLRWRRHGRWDLTALLNAAQAQNSGPEQRLWLIRLAEWLRGDGQNTVSDDGSAPASSTPSATPWPVRRLRHLVNLLERHPEHARAVRHLLQQVLRECDLTALLADAGFAPRAAFTSELGERLRLALLPGTPDTDDLGRLFELLFPDPADARWLEAIDADTLGRCVDLLAGPDLARLWRRGLSDSVQMLSSQVRAVGLSSTLRQRMDPALLDARPFHRLAQAAAHLADAVDAEQGPPDPAADPLAAPAASLRDLLIECRAAADSVRAHLAAFGISVDLVFQVAQLRERTERIEALLDALTSAQPLVEAQRLLVRLADGMQVRRGLRPLFAHHYSMLARKVAERSAETGEHYITRTRSEWLDMLARAAGGGLVIAGTTLAKFAVGALGFTAFWGGFWAGVNYAASFVLIHLLHWTVATKQPAMTAPAMAAKLEGSRLDAAQAEGFVDEVVHLIRSQLAGIAGNLAVVVPVVLAAQGLAWWLAGAPLVGPTTARYVLNSHHLLGPTAAFAAFTGVLLFASSLIAGWVENWFVYHRLDSAIAWNPGFVRALGAARAQRWSAWWRSNISGLAANISLGLLLGLVPALAAFFGLPIEVRHVTLSMGQLAAAAAALGPQVLLLPEFWWCLAAIPVIGALNLGVSFWLAFRVALRSRGLPLRERGLIAQALRQRLRSQPGSFLRPPAA